LLLAGADIKEMQPREFAEVYKGDFLGFWNSISLFKKPIIAAVNGYAVSQDWLSKFIYILNSILKAVHLSTFFG